jgi:hypothetical protein
MALRHIAELPITKVSMFEAKHASNALTPHMAVSNKENIVFIQIFLRGLEKSLEILSLG